ncbi:TlpA family protein disulfide reductase [Prauserella muralis]|uniref:Thiol reductase thioredoxin n=1 Tax=Prauserella muralis TaxID=588067 RepID=A0A2V4BBJ8_9PSEU|nr:thioredoxin family protein [Prauserella muralis]PXY31419.1 thiol reductase thioredoxin [Prauserella muralis]TWE14248.1 thiol-disulfide isomerase/thioredoxin [Prauserella muralis]
MTGLWVLVATVVAALAAGAVLYARNGRIRPARPGDTGTAGGQGPALPEPVAAALAPGTVTLVQISTTFCAPCRHTRAVLGPLAARTEGLDHVDLDVTHQPEVAHALGVLRTPTTIAFSEHGRELLRVSGVPKPAELLGALEPHLVPRAERGSHSEGG